MAAAAAAAGRAQGLGTRMPFVPAVGWAASELARGRGGRVGRRRRPTPWAPGASAAAAASRRGGRPAPALAAFRGDPCFPTAEAESLWNRSVRGGEGSPLRLLGSGPAPFGGGSPRRSIPRRGRNGRPPLASSPQRCFPGAPLGMKRSLVIARGKENITGHTLVIVWRATRVSECNRASVEEVPY